MITELCEACYDVWFVDSDTGGKKEEVEVTELKM